MKMLQSTSDLLEGGSFWGRGMPARHHYVIPRNEHIVIIVQLPPMFLEQNRTSEPKMNSKIYDDQPKMNCDFMDHIFSLSRRQLKIHNFSLQITASGMTHAHGGVRGTYRSWSQ